MARIVFADDAARARLNAITHPRVARARRALEATRRTGSSCTSIPLLFEAILARCDRTVVVVAPDDVRIARVIARDAAEREAVERRIARADRSGARARAAPTT